MLSNWSAEYNIPESTIMFQDDRACFICADCIDVVSNIANGSIDLIVADPPYNIGKDTWDKVEDYINWIGERLLCFQYSLRKSGSLYLFHNQIPTIAEIMIWNKHNTALVFRQFIVWNKRFAGSHNKGFLDGFVVTGGLRNYQQMAEYVLFYTLQDDTGLTTVMLDTNNFPTLRGYFKSLQEYVNLSKKAIVGAVGQCADHPFRWGSSQWDLPTRETYQQLISKLHIDKWCNFREYESLRLEYESLRYTFNNQKSHHSVWNYDIAERNGWHITPKPVELISNILVHSSNDGDIVLDPFMGSGSTAIAASRLGRRFLGIEINPQYCQLAIVNYLRHRKSS